MPAVARLLVFAAPLLIAAAPRAVAQRPSAVRVVADNDAFDFWVPPWDRTDHEYTSGVRGVVEYDGHPGVHLWPRFLRDTLRSATHAFSLGQAIYTGDASNRNGDAASSPVVRRAGSRPNAGWLYLEAAERDSSDRWTDDLSVAVGVVGRPALGERMQRLVHSLLPQYQRPVDWSRQLPFEPGFVARLTRTARLRSFGEGGWVRGAIVADVGGAAGTILTELAAGGGVTADVNAGRIPGTGSPLHVLLVADARAHAVLRDEFLDGTLFRPSDSVAREPFVADERAAVTLRWRQIGITYRGTSESRRYRSQAQAASWGTLEAEWRFAR